MIQDTNSFDRVQSIVEFLTAFHPEGKVTFQTFAEPKGSGGKPRILHSTSLDDLPSVINTVLEGNSVDGSKGVFFTVNRTDGLGREVGNIQLVTALFVDMDGGEPQNLKSLPEPSLVVQSKNGKHLYWVLEEPVALTPSEFKALQKGLAQITGGDPQVNDLTRVMRLPCSWHLKNPEEPFEVKVLKQSPLKYALADLRATIKGYAAKSEPVQEKAKVTKEKVAKKVEPKQQKTKAKYTGGNWSNKLNSALEELVRELLGTKEGERNVALNRATFKAGSLVRLGLAEEEVMCKMFKVGCQLGLEEEEVGATVDGALEEGIKKCFPFAVIAPESKVSRAKFLVEYHYQGRVKFNSRDNEVLLDGQIVDETTIFLDAVTNLDMDMTRDTFAAALHNLIQKNSFDPVKDHILALPSPATPVLADVCSKVFGLDDELSSKVFQVYLRGAVARALDPGCKFDLCLLLRGSQGTGKTTFFDVLGTINGRPYKTDLSASDKGKDELLKFRKTWIAELSEIGQMFRGRDLDAFKSLITATHDEFRAPYARESTKHPRSMAFAATANDEACLPDDEGNRRFICLDTGSNVYDIAWWRANRDAALAEARDQYLTGGVTYLDQVTQAAMSQRNREHTAHDPLTDKLQEFISAWTTDTYFQGVDAKGNTALFGFTCAEVLDILNNSGFKMGNSKGDQMRLSKALKNLGVDSLRTKAVRVYCPCSTFWREATGSGALRKTIDRMTGILNGSLVNSR